MMLYGTTFRIGAGAMAGCGLALSFVGLLVPIIILVPVGGVLLAAGAIGFRTVSYRDSRRPEAAHPAGEYFRRSLSFSDGNPVARFMHRRPGLQIAWFLFVAVAAVTVGVVAEMNRRENPRNTVGGIIFMLFGILAIVLAVLAYTKGRHP